VFSGHSLSTFKDQFAVSVATLCYLGDKLIVLTCASNVIRREKLKNKKVFARGCELKLAREFGAEGTSIRIKGIYVPDKFENDGTEYDIAILEPCFEG
jgi:hypothetical protein